MPKNSISTSKTTHGGGKRVVRNAKTGQFADVDRTNVSDKSKTILKENARRHSAALIRLANR